MDITITPLSGERVEIPFEHIETAGEWQSFIRRLGSNVHRYAVGMVTNSSLKLVALTYLDSPPVDAVKVYGIEARRAEAYGGEDTPDETSDAALILAPPPGLRLDKLAETLNAEFAKKNIGPESPIHLVSNGIMVGM